MRFAGQAEQFEGGSHAVQQPVKDLVVGASVEGTLPPQGYQGVLVGLSNQAEIEWLHQPVALCKAVAKDHLYMNKHVRNKSQTQTNKYRVYINKSLDFSENFFIFFI